MRNLIVPIALCIGLTFLAALGANAEGTLNGKIQKLSYFLGTWRCGPQAVTFKTAPGNSIHEHGVNGQVADDEYFAFNPVLMEYEMTGANNRAFHWFLRSSDGVNFSGKHFAGNARSYDVTLTYRRDSEKTMTVHQDTTTDAGNTGSDVECVRQQGDENEKP